jgi:hypothetical protein
MEKRKDNFPTIFGIPISVSEMEKVTKDKTMTPLEKKIFELVMEFDKGRDKIAKRLASANSKLEAIQNALPNPNTMALWEAGPTIFIRKIRAILDAP